MSAFYCENRRGSTDVRVRLRLQTASRWLLLRGPLPWRQYLGGDKEDVQEETQTLRKLGRRRKELAETERGRIRERNGNLEGLHVQG